MWRHLVIVAALALAACGGRPPAKPVGPLAVIAGSVDDYHPGLGGTVVDISDERGFVIASGPYDKQVQAMLKRSKTTRRSLYIRYDGGRGWVDNASLQVRFPAVEIRMEGKTLALRPAADGVVFRTRQETARRQMALGVALADAAEYAGARKALDAAIATKALGAVVDAQAQRLRANILSSWAYNLPPERLAEADALRIEALGQLDAVLQTETEAETQRSRAGVLADLGAYEEAVAAFQKLPDDQAYASAVGIASVRQLQGRADLALEALDAYAEDFDDPPSGPWWRFQRGWSLLDLGRNDEAVKDLTAALKSDPDFQWALVKRACGLARLGRLAEALADQQTLVGLAAEGWQVEPHTLQARTDYDRMLQVAGELKTALAQDPTRRLDAPCKGYWEPKPRPRSALLPG